MGFTFLDKSYQITYAEHLERLNMVINAIDAS